jgi:Rod binding domain-containing protein
MTDPTINPGADAARIQAQIEAKPRQASERGGPDKNDAAYTAAQEFEAFFLAQVLDQMFAGVGSKDALGGGSAEGVYRTMLNEEYAKVISKAGGVGVADAVYREMLRLQEVEK